MVHPSLSTGSEMKQLTAVDASRLDGNSCSRASRSPCGQSLVPITWQRGMAAGSLPGRSRFRQPDNDRVVSELADEPQQTSGEQSG